MDQEESNPKKLSEEFDDYMRVATQETVLNPEVKKKKIISWMIRNVLLVILYVLFWEYEWVRWSIYFTIPLSLFSLLSIFFWDYFLKRKIQKTKIKVEEADRLVEGSNAEIEKSN